MGVVRKQGSLTTITSVVGGLLGFVNTIFLFAKLMDEDEFGLAKVLVTLGVLFAQIAIIGFPNVMLRFFPYFQDKDKGHNGILFFGLMVGLFGFLVTLGLLYLFQPLVLSLYQEKSPLLVGYYEYVIWFGLAFLIFHLFSNYLRSLYKWLISRIIREIILRIFISASILLYYFDVVDFHGFVQVYTGAHLAIILILLGYTIYLKQFFLIPKDFGKIRIYGAEMLSLGAFSFFAGISATIVLSIDVMMLGTKGLDNVAVYSVAIAFTAFMMFPYRAITNLSMPRVSEYWKSGQMELMGKLYKRVSLLTFLCGFFIFIIIYDNLPNIVDIIAKPAYMAVTIPFVLLGLSRLFDVTSGLNGAILVTSSYYRLDLVFNLILLVLAALGNYYFIFVLDMGLVGAAMATMLSIFLYNVIRLVFVFRIAKIHPFSISILKAFLLGSFTLLILYFIPRYPNPWIDIAIRGSIGTIIYATPLIITDISPDIQQFSKLILSKISQFLNNK